MADHSEVAEYMVTSLDGTRHPALLARPGSGIVFDGQKKRWVLEPHSTANTIDYDDIYFPCSQARDGFLATANKYSKKLGQPPLDLNTSHSWVDVEKSVEAACAQLEVLASKDKDLSGASGKLKRVFRSLCRNAGAGENLAALVPSDTFTSVLCGGLKVIFSGLRQTGVYREEVYKALEDLPFILTDHAAHVKIYDKDRELHCRTAALYVAIFHALNHILGWFLKNTFVTGVRLAVNPAGFKEKLHERLAEVKIAAQRFENHVIKLSRQSQDESIQLQYWTAYRMNHLHDNVQTILNRTELLEDRIARAEVLEKLDPLLLDAWKEKLLKHHSTPIEQRSLPDLEPEEFLSHFLYEPNVVAEDFKSLKQQLHGMRGASVDTNRLAALHSNVRLRAWLTINEPSAILLNGRASRPHDLEVSLFSVKMIESLLEQHEACGIRGLPKVAVIPLAFLCGQHRDWRRDSNGAPEEVAMSLLLQLVDRCRERLDRSILRQCYTRTKPGNLGSICTSLESLIMCLDQNVILVLILDDLWSFSQPRERCEKTKELISRLVETYRKRPTATLKLLFSSPMRSEFVEDMFDESELLDLPRHLPTSHISSFHTKSRVKEPVDSGDLVIHADDKAEEEDVESEISLND
ncbi:MAG: hypothetical protein Q9165_006338 [Trypethelium subeluteriae]